jgi:competence protein ComEA
MKHLITLLLVSMLALPAWAAAPVDINHASAEEIAQTMNGVGLTKAAAIVAYRETNGPFTHIDELVNVKGIGLRTVDRNREVVEMGTDKKLAESKK